MAHIALYKLDLLDAFEARSDAWDWADFEQRLLQLRPTVFSQDAAGIIRMAHKDGSWPRTVKRFVLTRYRARAVVDEVFIQVAAAMPVQERQAWGLEPVS